MTRAGRERPAGEDLGVADRPAPKRDGRQQRWSKHNETRRRQIIDAAIHEIEAAPPGAEVQVQQIAARAGLSRTVVYRHFEDRSDLDRAVQQAILDGLWAELLPAVSLEGSANEIIRRIVSTYVRWAEAHPSLHLAADHDSVSEEGPLQAAMEQLAGQIAAVIEVAIVALGGKPPGGERAAAIVDPLVFGVVGAVFGAVRRWLTRRDQRISADTLERLAADSVWYVIAGHARSWGVELDPDVPLDALLTGAAATA